MTSRCPWKTRILPLALFLCLLATLANAAEVLIIADPQLKPVTELTAGIHKTLRASSKTYSPAEIKGKLARLVEREEARVVIALGRDALNEALTLPHAIPVIYDLVVVPPIISRPNTTGFYMATPVREYQELLQNQFRELRGLAVVGSREYLHLLAGDARIDSHIVHNAAELVNTVRQIASADALLILPDVSVVSATALEEVFLFSFRKNIPLLGVSERQVKEGALLALVVDLVSVGRQIGDSANRAIKSGSVGQVAPSPAKKFELYLNTETARRMKIRLPDEVIRMARRTYP